MKQYILVILFLAAGMVMTACSKKSSDAGPKVAREITTHELLDYQLLEQFDILPAYESQFGNKSRLYVYAVTSGNTPDEFRLLINSGFFVPIDSFTYDKETGITRVHSSFGTMALTRDEKDRIIPVGGFIFGKPEDFKELKSSYLQIVKTDRQWTFNDYILFRGVEGITGYYAFSDQKKWRYREAERPQESDLTWNYQIPVNTIWYGFDGGSAKYNNRFIFLPKGNGWKGKYTDKNILLVHTWVNLGKVINDVGICFFVE